ncbi:MAG: glycerate kinase [Gemmatimonadales bacterium]
MTHPDRRRLLETCFRRAVAAADPAAATLAALTPETPGVPVWIIAAGKASLPMAHAAVQVLAARDLRPAGGIVIPAEPANPPHPALQVVAGDHPVPGADSLRAAEALAGLVPRARGEPVWVLLSGGASSLMAGPVGGVTQAELAALFQALLGSGLEIHTMNAIRGRFSRWAHGRLAAALVPSDVLVLAVSDVIGDELPSIGSGPCSRDTTTAADVAALLRSKAAMLAIPPGILAWIEDHAAHSARETPKPDDPAFDRVRSRIIVGNGRSRDAACAAAAAAGLDARPVAEPLHGEAAAAGTAVARSMLEARRGTCLVWGGETTVTLPPDAPPGGRCQELALAAARRLHQAGAGAAITILAAGTDGRDGTTDAAGAVVDGLTWQRIERAGRNPQSDLDHHRAHPALDAAGALLRTGPTGTNVMDLVVAVRSERDCGFTGRP